MISPAWWDDEHSYPAESDWTLSLAERMNRDPQLVVLSPLLSRSTNIGREQGVHSHPERHDLLMKGLVMNLERGPFDYKINPKAIIPRRNIDYDTMTTTDGDYKTPM
jgi:hypothetical protein